MSTTIITVCSAEATGNDVTDPVVITSETGEEYYVFEPLTTVHQYLNKSIECLCRVEYLKGKNRNVIHDVTVRRVLNQFNKVSNFKLYTDFEIHSGSTVNFFDCEIGETYPNSVVYCISAEHKDSAKAHWLELVIQDKVGRVAKLFIFNNFEDGIEYECSYVITSLLRSEYGFQSTQVDPYEIERVGDNPEVELCTEYLKSIICEDKDLEKFCEDMNYLLRLGNYRDDKHPSIGSILVELAHSVYVAREILNISPILDLNILQRALFLKYSYALKNNKSTLSDNLNSILISAGTDISKDRRIMCILDSDSEHNLLEKSVLEKIKDLVVLLNNARFMFTTDILNNDKIWRK